MVTSRKTPELNKTANLNSQPEMAVPMLTGDNEPIRHLKQAINEGKHWYIAMLEAIGLWTAPEEERHGRRYRYLIDGEAFDWLLLAERLCEAVDGVIPDDEKLALLFRSKPPVNLTPERFKELIGSSKYCQYLNYFYGVAVETALILVVQEEVRKERRTSGFGNDPDCINEVCYRIYGSTQAQLLRQFRREKGCLKCVSLSLTELKEFTYWLFKYRLEHCEKAKVASDTQRALERLQKAGIINGFLTIASLDNEIYLPTDQE